MKTTTKSISVTEYVANEVKYKYLDSITEMVHQEVLNLNELETIKISKAMFYVGETKTKIRVKVYEEDYNLLKDNNIHLSKFIEYVIYKEEKDIEPQKMKKIVELNRKIDDAYKELKSLQDEKSRLETEIDSMRRQAERIYEDSDLQDKYIYKHGRYIGEFKQYNKIPKVLKLIIINDNNKCNMYIASFNCTIREYIEKTAEKYCGSVTDVRMMFGCIEAIITAAGGDIIRLCIKDIVHVVDHEALYREFESNTKTSFIYS